MNAPTSPIHVPVMGREVLEELRVRPGGCYLDGTLGEGGHTQALLEAAGAEGRVIALDRDPAMIERAQARLRPGRARLDAVRARFSYLAEVLAGLGVKAVDGVVLDLGLCSAQIEDGGRGFSFMHSKPSTPLDMRMDPGHGESAAALLERLDARELADVLRAGGVPGAGRVARQLRERAPLYTVGALLDAVDALGLPSRRHHPATLVFQALRMAVNEEVCELERGLEAAHAALAPGGRLVVLSYHSGEDRRVKQFFAREARGCLCPPELPICGCGHQPTLKLIRSGDGPEPAEVVRNPRARSARLRVGERL